MNYLIKKFGKEKRWVNYRLQKVGDRNTKIPYSVKGRKASSVNPEDWSTYDEAKQASENVGIVFTPAQDVLGIDIDHCLTNKQITHEQKETIAELILEADTYTEFSPSGEGLHLILKIEGALELTSNKKAPYEAYTSGRYFTFTGNCYGEPRPVRTVVPEEALRILSIIGYPWNKDQEPQKEVTTETAPIEKVGNSLTNDEILKKMFSSKGGRKIKKLFEGDTSEYKNDESSADMAFCSHLAFWTGKDKDKMEEIWLNSPLGSREKTQKRKDYRNRTLRAAILNCTTVYEEKVPVVAPKELDLLYVSGPRNTITYLQNTENMCRILRNHEDFHDRFRFDEFKNVYEIYHKDKWRTLEDNDAVEIQTEISVLFPEWFGRVGKEMVYDAIIKVSKENAIDSARDYLESLVWDKKYRLDTWLSKVYGVSDDKYHRAVASNWMKGLVKRIIEPGCKFDFVLVLEGPQGARKSTSLAILGGDWHVETAMSTDSKDFFMQFQGKAIIEFSEGETLSRTEVKRMKAIITMQSDKYRPPYERTSQDFPRRCVFAMTTNQEEYLKDETGNRRWLPVAVVFEEADVKWLEENRDQLFAEAYHRVVNLKETTYEFPKEETLRAQQARRIHDPNSEAVWEWYNKLKDSEKQVGITIHQVYKEVLHGGLTPSKPLNKYDEMSIASILRETLGLESRRSMFEGSRTTRWFKKGEQQLIKEETNILEEW